MARPKSDIEPRIVHAARRRFLADGVDGASLRRIAKDAGTSIGMIYYYFPTKDELFLAVVEEVYVGLLADLSEALAADTSLEARIVRVSGRIGKMSELERDVVKLVIREALGSSSRFDRLLERFRRGHLAIMATAVSEGMDRGEMDAGHPLVVALMATFALTAMPQLIRNVAAGQLPFSSAPEPEELAERLVHILFHGIAPPQPSEEI